MSNILDYIKRKEREMSETKKETTSLVKEDVVINTGHDFIYPYGPKRTAQNDFNVKEDITDQRAPINDPQTMYEQFMQYDVADVMDELESENIEDFDNDVYEYEDRSELGEDIAALQQPKAVAAVKALSQKANTQQSGVKQKDEKQDGDDIVDGDAA